MAKNITISLSTVFNGSGIKSAIYGMQEMQNVTKNVQQSLEGAKSKWEQMATTLSASIVSIERLNGIVQSMASAYSNAELNATRLEVIMRQRMKSTDAEIASIKKLTSAQADLGIISAGVQRAGAQQLATFLYQKSSLEVLIPAMNNLVAQQRGFSAEAGDAVNVANLMGKAMMGMTSALRRVGITFTEAQEAAIKNGNEQERAAMLAQIITDNVGEMNKALAQTDAGKQKQLANEMGALRAKIGSLVSSVAPYLNVGASIANMAMGFMSLRNVVVAFSSKIGSAYMVLDKFILKGVQAATRVKWLGNAFKIFAIGANTASRGVHAVGVALRGVLAASGVGLVLWGISAAFSALTGKADEAAEKQREAAEEAARVRKEYEQWKRSLTDVGQATGEYAAKELSAVEQLYKKATDLAGTYKERHAAARQLINDYPTYLGQLSEEAIMTGKAAGEYKKLCDNIKQAAYARALQKKIEDLYAERIEIEDKINKRTWSQSPETKAQMSEIYRGAREEANSKEAELRKRGPKFIQSKRGFEKEIEEARLSAYNDYITRHAVSLYGGTQFKSYSTTQIAQGELAELEEKLSIVDNAIEDLSNRKSNIKVDPVIERGAGGHTPTKGTPAKSEKPYTPPENLAEIKSYEELSKAVQYYNKVKDAATTDADRLKAQQTIDTLEDMRKAWDAASSTAKGYEPPKDIADIRSIDQANEALTHYRNAFDAATDDVERHRLQGIIDKIEALKKSWTGTTETVKADTPRWRSTLDEIRADLDRIYALPPKLWKVEVKGMGFEALTKQIRYLEKMKYMPGVNADDIKGIDETIARLQQMRAASLSGMETFSGMWDATKGLQGGIQSMTKVTDENATAWEKVSAVVDGAMQMYQAVAQIIQIVDAVITASSATKQSTSAANVASSNAEATADTTAAAASMFKAHAWLPWIGVGLGAAAVATMLATMFSLPKYAQGGIAYGPTVGMFGEYANASTNPEVVAPLDRLRTLIQPQGNLGGEVEFRIEGRTLRGILNKVDNHNSRI